MVKRFPIVHELRACQLCTYSETAGDDLCCAHPLVSRGTEPTPCAAARRADGLCGIDARHQHWPHLDRQLARPVVPVLLPMHPHATRVAA